MSDVPPEEPAADPRDALIREQAQRIEAQAQQIAALEALVADLREQVAAAERSGSRNSSNLSMPPSADDLVLCHGMNGGADPASVVRTEVDRAGAAEKARSSSTVPIVVPGRSYPGEDAQLADVTSPPALARYRGGPSVQLRRSPGFIHPRASGQ